MNTIATPRPTKKLTRSVMATSALPTGDPGVRVPDAAQSGLISVPSANQAPATAASSAASMANGREAVDISTAPASATTAPGTISSQTRPELTVHAVSGVNA